MVRDLLTDPSIALMIRGGSHMTLSEKTVRSAQTSFLLANGILPISLDYRPCPEINLIDGPITEIRDAYAWARAGLQMIVWSKGITVDAARIAVIGWSTGVHLAMTTAWTTKAHGLRPPCAILNVCAPIDFESGDLDVRRAERYPERKMSVDKFVASRPKHPITSYDNDTIDSTGLGWVRPGEPRSELVLSLFKDGNGLPMMLNGITDPNWHRQPNPDKVAAISPMAPLRKGTYTTPYLSIVAEKDEIVPVS